MIRFEQFDTPGAVLGTPATPYVAEFVGADRGLKRLSVTARAGGVSTRWRMPDRRPSSQEKVIGQPRRRECWAARRYSAT